MVNVEIEGCYAPSISVSEIDFKAEGKTQEKGEETIGFPAFSLVLEHGFGQDQLSRLCGIDDLLRVFDFMCENGISDPVGSH
jgi:hypothetical protein